jgi:hypothetical protein
VLAHQQRVHLGQAQRPLLGEPRFDAFLVRRDGLPFGARVGQRARLNALRDLVNLVLGRLAALRQRAMDCGMHVTTYRLAVDARLTRDAVKTLPRRPAAQHLFDVGHRQLPVGHGHLPTATRAVVGTNPDSLPGRSTRDPPGGPGLLVPSPCKSAGPMSLRKSAHPSRAGGPLRLQKGGPMTLQKTPSGWSHEAANRHPTRRTGETRNCTVVGTVTLNPTNAHTREAASS